REAMKSSRTSPGSFRPIARFQCRSAGSVVHERGIPRRNHQIIGQIQALPTVTVPERKHQEESLMSEAISPTRRRFLKVGMTTAAGVVLPAWTLTKGAPAIIAADNERPKALQGLHFGDPSNGSVVVLSRSDRAARMLVEWSYDEQFQDVHRLIGPHALETTDFTARQDLEGLEAGREVFVRVFFQSLDNARANGEPVTGRFIVPPDDWVGEGRVERAQSDIRFLWSG